MRVEKERETHLLMIRFKQRPEVYTKEPLVLGAMIIPFLAAMIIPFFKIKNLTLSNGSGSSKYNNIQD